MKHDSPIYLAAARVGGIMAAIPGERRVIDFVDSDR